MAGTEQPLMNLLSKSVDYIELIKRNLLSTKPPQRYQLFSQPVNFFGGGSHNHKFLRIIVDLCLAYIYNDKLYISTCEQRLILFLKEQEEKGHCCIAKNAIETLSGSHGQLNLAAASVAYLFWCHYGQLPSLGTLLIHWHWSELSLIKNCKLPDTYLSNNGYSPTFHCPGWRAIKGSKEQGEEEVITTSNPARDLYGRIMLGYSYPDEDRDLYKDKYNLGARCLLLLKDNERQKLIPPKFDRTILEWKPPLPYDYQIWVSPSPISSPDYSFVARFLAPAHKDLCLVTLYDRRTGPIVDQYDNQGIMRGGVIIPATPWSKNNRIQP